jgi:carboxypeptidase Q
MKKIVLLIGFLPFVCIGQTDEDSMKKIYDETMTNGHVYENLRVLCKQIGHRLSGSAQAAAAVDYSKQLMQSYGFDTVYLQPVMVPKWVRGKSELVQVVNSSKFGQWQMNALALGNSVGTGPKGVLANVVEVKSMAEVEQLGKKLEGKIVFYNIKMDPANVNDFNAYGGAVVARAYGASDAAKFGARAVIVRSVTNRNDDVPHTGSLSYKPMIAQIPAVAISTNDANRLSELLTDQSDLKIYIETHCAMQGEVLSYNVIGELRGAELPDEIIAVGGHLDSWDVGEGAHDDGAGCMQAIEVLRLFKKLGIKPRRTIRAVMWMNEENGLRGGREYARVAKEKGEKHIAALESDSGGLLPQGFTSSGTDEQRAKLAAFKPLFEKFGVWKFDERGGGADIGPLADQGPLLIGLRPASHRYFKYHHTPIDVFEEVDQRELELGAAAMAALVYLIDRRF